MSFGDAWALLAALPGMAWGWVVGHPSQLVGVVAAAAWPVRVMLRAWHRAKYRGG